MARLTRQELKKNEFASSFAALQEWFLQNQKRIASTAGLAAAVVVVVVGGMMLLRSRQSQASGDFGTALQAYHAPVTATPPPNYTGLSFKTDEEKFQEALKRFSEVASRYSWLSQGKFARYYVGLCERELGKSADAERDLKAVADEGNPDRASLAKMALAALYEQTNRNDEAEKLYRDVESHPSNAVPKATAALARAELYEKTKPSEAKALYQEIQKDNTGMAAADAASKALQGDTQKN